MVDTLCLKNLGNMNVPEFTTVVIYYLSHPEVCSSALREALLTKIEDAASEFNEYQLAVFEKLCLGEFKRCEESGGRTDQVKSCLIAI